MIEYKIYIQVVRLYIIVNKILFPENHCGL